MSHTKEWMFSDMKKETMKDSVPDEIIEDGSLHTLNEIFYSEKAAKEAATVKSFRKDSFIIVSYPPKTMMPWASATGEEPDWIYSECEIWCLFVDLKRDINRRLDKVWRLTKKAKREWRIK